MNIDKLIQKYEEEIDNCLFYEEEDITNRDYHRGRRKSYEEVLNDLEELKQERKDDGGL